MPPYPAMADYGRMKRTELVRALVEPELGQQLRRAAAEQDRSLSYTVHENSRGVVGAATAAAERGGGMTRDDDTLELKLARAAYAAAEEIKKTAERDQAAAEYDRGQADWRLREI